MKIFILFVLIFAFSACQKETAETKPQNVKPTPTAATTPPATPLIPKNGNYDAKGVVTKINLEGGSVEINHEKIEGLMEPMIMEFHVAKKAELQTLKVGDKVDFVIEYKDHQEKIISIKKAQ